MSTAIAPPAPAQFVPVEEYLRTSYQPDCDYEKGLVTERNVGEFEHGRVQLELSLYFRSHESLWSVVTALETRLQVAPDHYRVPDVMVLRAGTKVSRIVREAPLLCIEVLSPEDTWHKMRERLNDYLSMGVEHVWCFEPEAREAWRYTAEGYALVREPELTIAGTPIRINLREVFAVLDEVE